MRSKKPEISVNEWQIAEIHAGIQEADRGEFATEQEVKAALTKWTRAESCLRKRGRKKQSGKK